MSYVQPQPASEVTLDCWYMDDDSEADQRLPHRREPNEAAGVDAIRALGVVSWRLDADQHEADPKLEAIRKVCGTSKLDPSASLMWSGVLKKLASLLRRAVRGP